MSNYAAANYELILSLKPDLVIAWQSGNGDKMINPSAQVGHSGICCGNREMDQSPNLFRRFGQLSGQDKMLSSVRLEFT